MEFSRTELDANGIGVWHAITRGRTAALLRVWQIGPNRWTWQATWAWGSHKADRNQACALAEAQKAAAGWWYTTGQSTAWKQEEQTRKEARAADHAKRAEKAARMTAKAAANAELVSSFWAEVQKGEPDACWPWTGARNHKGYGITAESRWGTPLAHRVALALTAGPIAPGKLVLHSCDNPPCCNPAHLRAGTHAENTADMFARGRQPNAGRWLVADATHCLAGHQLTQENTQQLEHAPGRFRPVCLTCLEQITDRKERPSTTRYG